MPGFPTPPHNTRLGFHYYPDTLHFRDSDLSFWVPELKSLGASWLTLLAPGDRAVPESFIKGLISASIEPILHFNLPLAASLKVADISLLFDIYAKWGAHYVILFDRPNRRASWPPHLWVQNALVDRFLDRFIVLAEQCLKSGLVPVLSPLVPGGDYWDTAFLREALQSLDRRGNHKLLENLVLGAYAITSERPLSWGRGGPERWPAACPYRDSPVYEDHRGLYIYEWYTTIAESILGFSPPVILFGITNRTHLSKQSHQQENHEVTKTLAIAEALLSLNTDKIRHGVTHAKSQGLDPFPSGVLAGNFWLLSADPGTPGETQAWFQTDGTRGKLAEALRLRIAGISLSTPDSGKKSFQSQADSHPIQHYLLLPAFDWGISDWHFTAARPFIHKYQPMIGFSLKDARLAARVTVVGGPEQFPEEDLESLRASGCVVERIDGDGMSIATQLSER
jgi:hypothetical protein